MDSALQCPLAPQSICGLLYLIPSKVCSAHSLGDIRGSIPPASVLHAGASASHRQLLGFAALSPQLHEGVWPQFRFG